MDQPELSSNEKYSTHSARGKNQKELDDLINDWTKTKNLKEIELLCNDNGNYIVSILRTTSNLETRWVVISIGSHSLNLLLNLHL